MTVHDFAESARVRVVVVMAVLATLVVMGAGAFLTVAWQRGTERRRSTAECHQRGPAYHYWRDRDRCVMYVDGQR